jgi:cell division GTPase FtsZ
MIQAEAGIKELKDAIDTLIVIPNQKLLSFVGKQTSLTNAFGIVDDVLQQAVGSISDLIVTPGLVNLDFADVKTIMGNMGKAIMGSGSAAGENRAIEAAEKAISSPLLDDANIDGARQILINITGGGDMTLAEVDEAATLITENAHEDANIIFGTVNSENMEGQMRVTVIATGFENAGRTQPRETAQKKNQYFEPDERAMEIKYLKERLSEQKGEIIRLEDAVLKFRKTESWLAEQQVDAEFKIRKAERELNELKAYQGQKVAREVDKIKDKLEQDKEQELAEQQKVFKKLTNELKNKLS